MSAGSRLLDTCAFCGARMRSESEYCRQCGERTGWIAVQTSGAARARLRSPRRRSSGPLVVAWVAGGLALFVATAVAIALLMTTA